MLMQILPADAAQWVNLTLNALALVLFVTAAALAVWKLHLEKKGAREEDLAKVERVRKTLEQLLRGSVFGLVTAAERSYGAGEGAIKKSAVLAQLMCLLPEQWRTLFDAQALGALIESGLQAAKELWAQNGEARA